MVSASQLEFLGIVAGFGLMGACTWWGADLWATWYITFLRSGPDSRRFWVLYCKGVAVFAWLVAAAFLSLFIMPGVRRQ